ncbi:LLM class flavin-dependent oxidoreductase [Micromonospora chalcea]|uniref:LLM class flavin-dependent oxidoreductase n=2 Tax=Micromonospora chalcea TaxID=1874 RepID=A0ABX9Y6G0_MICCH|nr:MULTISPECIES: LLM class flavin-dependent oxidoreductase [unclassified Micromonospora]NHO80542.1 LLM class flavin-dependent oxidoreductase [Micromonospora sp. CMU55-4]RQW94675.1 LLM class flavin-dependent oxidoreductase [Micromonospora chalcea]RQX49507.1 LLM class flavin-dependent oxidoreductase [Micromonospora chalcea]WBB83987.1 LLM class flavin-dependent oxidoreductase [Micromonospora sp. WMMC264]
MFDRSHRPTALPEFVRALDRMPVDDCWIVEDIGWAGSVALTATALANSSRLRIGMGVCPVPLRNPVLHAMELAALAELHPGRLIAGLGHGSPARLRRVAPRGGSQLALLEATLAAVRRLLAGDRVTLRRESVHLDDARLEHVPPVPPALYVGAVGPRTLALSGRIADGTVLAEGCTPDVLGRDLAYLRAGGAGPHEVVVYQHLLIHSDKRHVEKVGGPVIAKFAELHRVAPDPAMIAAGDPGTAAKRVTSLWDAGADTVVLRPIGADPLTQVRRVLEALGR